MTEERFDTEGLDQAWDHEPPLWERGLAEEVVEHVPCGPTNNKVYALKIGWTNIWRIWRHHGL